MGEFRMPSLGADMAEGTLVEWLVKPGDAVHRGDIVAVVDTEKAAIDVEVFEDGIVADLLVEPGARVPVGTPLALLQSAAPSTPRQPAAATSPLVRRLASDKGLDIGAVAGSGSGGHVTRADVERLAQPAPATGTRLRVSPLARRTADRLAVDLSRVTGSGPDGAIRLADVTRSADSKPRLESHEPPPAQAAAAKPDLAPARPGHQAERAAAMQRAIANLMGRSNREIPHYYLDTHVDLSRAQSWLERENLRRPVADRLLSAVLLLKAVALAARDHPAFNGFWTDDRFQPGSGVHLGVAIALRGGGLIAPALHDADTASPDELMARLRDLIARARAGKLRSSEMADPTLTVTSLGDQGVDRVYGVIYPPQVALVGFGKIAQRPWAGDGMVGARPSVYATLAADHRAGNGHSGALFLATIDRYLQKPEEL